MDRLDAGAARADRKVRDAEAKVRTEGTDPETRAEAERRLADAKAEAIQAASAARRAGSGEPGDPKAGGSVGTLFSAYV